MQCRICLQSTDEPYWAPCKCKGSQRWVHVTCLQQFRRCNRRINCPTCHGNYHDPWYRPYLGSIVTIVLIFGWCIALVTLVGVVDLLYLLIGIHAGFIPCIFELFNFYFGVLFLCMSTLLNAEIAKFGMASCLLLLSAGFPAGKFWVVYTEILPIVEDYLRKY